MSFLSWRLVFGRPLGQIEVAHLIEPIFAEALGGISPCFDIDRLGDFPVLWCSARLDAISWPDFFHAVRLSKGHLEEHRVPVIQVIIGGDSPSWELLSRGHGAWISLDSIPEEWRESLFVFLHESPAFHPLNHWVFLPFGIETPHEVDVAEYEPCPPDERLIDFGDRINGSSSKGGIPFGLRVRMQEGTRPSDYINAFYRSALGREQGMGGFGVLTTTVFQMNDKLELMNHYSERLTGAEDLNLLSLPAMHLRLTDERDETDLSNQVARGHVRVTNIRLGD